MFYIMQLLPQEKKFKLKKENLIEAIKEENEMS